MRTTLNVEDDVLAALKKYAADRRLTLSPAASDLILRGVENEPKLKIKNGFALLELPLGAPPITDQLVRKYAEDYYDENGMRVDMPLE